MLYQWDIGRQPVEQVMESFWRLIGNPEGDRAFPQGLFEGTLEHLDTVDALIREHSERWRLERMSAVDRNILRLGVYELLLGETPKKVVINEALEVTKKFSTPEAVQFINGILDAVAQRIEAAKEVP